MCSAYNIRQPPDHQTIRLQDYLLPLLLIPLLCTSGPAPKNTEPTVVAGTLRYEQASKQLEATLQLTPLDTSANATYPALFGTAVPPFKLAGPGNFRARRLVAWPVDLNLTVPCPDGPNCPLTIHFDPPFPDSIPAQIDKKKSLRIPVAETGLLLGESLIMFFEPNDRSAPRRLQLMGPTSSGNLTIRKEALRDIPAGNYEVYLVKQQLSKDSSATVISSIQTEYFTNNRSVKVVE